MGHPHNALDGIDLWALPPGRHTDGGGLQLFHDIAGSRRWVLRTTVAGVRRDHGLGSLRDVTLPQARTKAQATRYGIKYEGKDPISERKHERLEAKLAAARLKTFKECAAEYLAKFEKTWSNPKHRQQWRNT